MMQIEGRVGLARFLQGQSDDALEVDGGGSEEGGGVGRAFT